MDISINNLEEVARLLNTLLADEYVLYTKTRNAHWNIQGLSYIELHKFFEGEYAALDVIIDDVAERVRSLGHFALASLKDFSAITRLSEHNHDFSDHNHVIQTLLEDHEALIRSLRKDISTIADELRDTGTADFMTDLMEQHVQMSWMLRARLT